jgi:hypothetical protein
MTTIEQSTPKAAWYSHSAHDVAAELGVEALAQFLHVGLAASRRGPTRTAARSSSRGRSR